MRRWMRRRARRAARPIAPWVWEVLIPASDGAATVAAIVQTNAEAGKVIADGRYLVVYTLAEIGNVLASLPDALKMAKQVFPGAWSVPRAQGARMTWARDLAARGR